MACRSARLSASASPPRSAATASTRSTGPAALASTRRSADQARASPASANMGAETAASRSRATSAPPTREHASSSRSARRSRGSRGAPPHAGQRSRGRGGRRRVMTTTRVQNHGQGGQVGGQLAGAIRGVIRTPAGRRGRVTAPLWADFARPRRPNDTISPVSAVSGVLRRVRQRALRAVSGPLRAAQGRGVGGGRGMERAGLPPKRARSTSAGAPDQAAAAYWSGYRRSNRVGAAPVNPGAGLPLSGR